MRVAFFTDSYHPSKDGIVTAICDYRTELERRGHKVFIFAPGARKTIEQNQDRNVFYYPSLAFPPYPDYRLAYFPYSAHRLLKPLSIDIIHNHGEVTMAFAAIYSAYRLRLPLLSSFHTLLPEGGHYLADNKIVKDAARYVAWKLLKRLYSTSGAVTAPSLAMKRVMEENGIGPVEVLPNGVDLRRFRPGRKNNFVRARHGLEGKTVISTVGRLVKEKNLELLIRAAPHVLSKNPDAAFLIVGRGPHENHLRQLVEDMRLSKNFIFSGFVEESELPCYYQAADIFAFPSVFETQGLSAIEAMACGKPVAGADIFASRGLVRGKGNGALFNPYDPADCARKINRLIQMKGEPGLRQGALKVARQFSVERCTDRLVKTYERLISQG